MKRLYRIFFFLAFPLSNYSVWFSMQADFSASSYLYIYLFKIPSHPQHSDTLLSSHTVPLCPTTVLCLFKVAIHFHFYHFISSLNDNINECITFWKRDEGSKERWIYTPPASPSLSPSLSTYQMYALLGRAKHMEMEPQQMGKSHTGSPDDIWIMNNREETALSYKQRCDVQDRPQFSPR